MQKMPNDSHGTRYNFGRVKYLILAYFLKNNARSARTSPLMYLIFVKKSLFAKEISQESRRIEFSISYPRTRWR